MNEFDSRRQTGAGAEGRTTVENHTTPAPLPHTLTATSLLQFDLDHPQTFLFSREVVSREGRGNHFIIKSQCMKF